MGCMNVRVNLSALIHCSMSSGRYEPLIMLTLLPTISLQKVLLMRMISLYGTIQRMRWMHCCNPPS